MALPLGFLTGGIGGWASRGRSVLVPGPGLEGRARFPGRFSHGYVFRVLAKMLGNKFED